MVTTKLNLSMTEPQVRQIYAKQGDTGRVLDISLDQTPEDGTLRILRPDGVEVTSEAVTGGEVESGSTFESLTEADVTELTVGIEPVQDLNGYDAPWVGGAGKNLLNITTTTQTVSGVTFTVNSDGTIKANGTASARIALALATNASETPILNKSVIMNGCPSGGSTNTYFIQWYGYDGASAVANDTGNGTSAFTPTSTAGVIAIVIQSGVAVNNLVFKPMIRLSTETDPTWQPYSNICPITGHDEVTVTRTGKNLITGFPSITQYGVTFTPNADGSVTANGTATGGAATCLISASRPIFASFLGKEVILSGCPSGGSASTYRLQWWKYAVNSGGGTITASDYGDGTTPFIPTETSGNIAIVISTGVTVNNVTFRPMVRFASETDDAYEPYRSNTYTTSLGQTVYGGTLDLVSGVLTVDKVIQDTFTVATYQQYGNNRRFNISYPSGITPNYKGATTYGISNIMPCLYIGTIGSIDLATEPCFIPHTTGILVTMTESTGVTTVAEMATWLSNNSAQFVYELATPQTYTLTAQQIKTLVGTNNVWASSGDIVNITFTYGGLLSELPSDATSVVGKCYCDVEQNGVSSMPFTLNIKKNERQ